MESDPLPPSLGDTQLHIKARTASSLVRAEGGSRPQVSARLNRGSLTAVSAWKMARLTERRNATRHVDTEEGWSLLVTAVHCQPLGGLGLTQDSSWSVNGAETLALLFSIHNSAEKQAKQCWFVFEQQWGAFHCTVQLSGLGAGHLGK